MFRSESLNKYKQRSDLFVYKQFFTTEMLDYGPNNPRLTPSGQT